VFFLEAESGGKGMCMKGRAGPRPKLKRTARRETATRCVFLNLRRGNRGLRSHRGNRYLYGAGGHQGTRKKNRGGKLHWEPGGKGSVEDACLYSPIGRKNIYWKTYLGGREEIARGLTLASRQTTITRSVNSPLRSVRWDRNFSSIRAKGVTRQE